MLDTLDITVSGDQATLQFSLEHNLVSRLFQTTNIEQNRTKTGGGKFIVKQS